MNNHGGSVGATLNGNPADKIPPNLCYPLEPQIATIEHQRLQHQQRQTNYNNFGEFCVEGFPRKKGKKIINLHHRRMEASLNEISMVFVDWTNALIVNYSSRLLYPPWWNTISIRRNRKFSFSIFRLSPITNDNNCQWQHMSIDPYRSLHE